MSIVGMRKKMGSYFKFVMLGVAVAFAVGFVGMNMGGSGMGGRQDGEALSGALAKVNGEKLERKVYWLEVYRQLTELQQTQEVGPTEESRLRGMIFDQLVGDTLRVQAAKKEGLRVSKRDLRGQIDNYVDGRIKELKEQLLAGRKKKSDKVFEAQLAKLEPGMTVAKKKNQLRKELWKHKDDIRKAILVEKLGKKLESSVRVTDKFLLESYDEVKLKQITVSTQKRSSAQAEKRAKDVVERLRKGADFAELATAHSDDGFKELGGDRGPIRRVWLEKELRDVAFKLKPGEISDPIKTDRGFVVLRSEGVKRNLPADFDDPKKKKEYRESLLAQERGRAQYEYFRNLREKAKIEVYDPELEAYLAYKGVLASLGSGMRAEHKSKVEKAIKAYRVAIVQAGDDSGVMARSYVQIGYLYNIMLTSGLVDTTEEERKKYELEAKRALQDALNYTESNEIRMILARMYVDAGDYDKAAEHLEIASENAFDDYETRMRILSLYQQMNRPDLAAKEQKWLDEYMEQRAAEAPSSEVTVPITAEPGAAGGGENSGR